MSLFCTTEGCNNYSVNLRVDFCMSCIMENRKQERISNSPAKIKKQPNKIAPKRKDQLTKYKIARDLFLLNHKVCQFAGCNAKSTVVHHMKSRSNEWLLDSAYWLAVCEDHHRFIEMNPKFSKEHGYSISRSSNNEKPTI